MSNMYLTDSSGKLLRIGGRYLCFDPDRAVWYTMTIDDVDYSHVNTTRTLVRGYNNTEQVSVFIPPEISGSPVEIGTGNFNSSGNMENIMLSDTTFGTPTLNGDTIKTVICTGSKIARLSVSGSNVTRVDVSGCSALTYIKVQSAAILELPTITSDVIASLNDAFSRCTALTDASGFVIPPNVTDINQMLRYNTALKTAPLLANNFTRYGVAFGGTQIKEVTITNKDFNPKFEMFDSLETGYVGDNYVYHVYSDSAYYKWYREYALKGGRDVNYSVIEFLDEPSIKDIVLYGDSYLNYETSSIPHADYGMIVPYLGRALSAENVRICNWAVGGSSTVSASQYFERHPDKYSKPTVIWLGANDTAIAINQSVANIQSYIDSLTGDYIVLGMLCYNWSEARNAAYAEAFGSHYYDPRVYLMQNGMNILGKTPTEEEATQIANNEMPLLYFDDEAVPHPHVWACQVISKMLYDIFKERGWVDTSDGTSFGENTGVTISATELSMTAGETASLTATADNGQEIEWATTDENVATVVDGEVTGVAAGTCYVVARGGYYSKFCTVTVN